MEGRVRKKLPMEALYPLMQEAFAKGQEFRMITHGTSMAPLIGDGCDTVVLRRPEGPLKKGDIPLYRRGSGQFVLHRVVGVRGGRYVLCGDNQVDLEYGVRDADVAAVACAVVKPGGRVVRLCGARYRLYCARTALRRHLRLLRRRLRRRR